MKDGLCFQQEEKKFVISSTGSQGHPDCGVAFLMTPGVSLRCWERRGVLEARGAGTSDYQYLLGGVTLLEGPWHD